VIRNTILLVIGLVIGLSIGIGYTYHQMYGSILEQAHWSNELAYIGPLDRDLLYLKDSYWSNSKLDHFIMGMTVYNITIAVCTRHLLTDFQLRQLHRIINKIKTGPIVTRPYWVLHFSKKMDPVLNGNVENRKAHFNICNVFHVDSDKTTQR